MTTNKPRKPTPQQLEHRANVYIADELDRKQVKANNEKVLEEVRAKIKAKQESSDTDPKRD